MKKKGAWEAKSSQLREAMRAARMYKKAVASGVCVIHFPTPPPFWCTCVSHVLWVVFVRL